MRPIVRDALGVGVAVGALGLSFGALAVAAGLSVPQACALSLLMFTGASQFAFVGLIGGGAAAAVATALLLGARNALYGLRLAPYLRPRGLAAHLVIDESAAMAVARHARRDPPRLLVDRPRRLRLLEPRDADRRAGRQRDLRPERVRPRRRRAGRVPRAARAALAGARAAGDRRLAAVAALVAVPLVPAGVPVLVAAAVAMASRWRAAVGRRWVGGRWPAGRGRVRRQPGRLGGA